MRAGSPSPSVVSEDVEAKARQHEEEEKRMKLQLYVFVLRCIAYPFNAQQSTNIAKRQAKVSGTTFDNSYAGEIFIEVCCCMSFGTAKVNKQHIKAFCNIPNASMCCLLTFFKLPILLQWIRKSREENRSFILASCINGSLLLSWKI